MARQKAFRFADSLVKPNIFQPGKPGYQEALHHWDEYFGRHAPLVLEVGCGKGEYTIGLAQALPDRDYIGLDLKGPRIWVGADKALALGLRNVAFIRAKAHDLLQFVPPGRASQIWLPFPDPQTKFADERRRLTSDRFLGLYQRVLGPVGTVHLKTDHASLYEYSLSQCEKYGLPIVAQTADLYSDQALLADHHGIRTYFEERYLAARQPIHYLVFSLEGAHVPDVPTQGRPADTF